MAHRAGTLAALKSAPAIPAYLVLLRVGFTMRRSLLNVRCALTAPFHPYLRCRRRYIFCCTGRLCALKRKSRTLSGTLPCGVRTFLPLPTLARGRQRSSSRLQPQLYPAAPGLRAARGGCKIEKSGCRETLLSPGKISTAHPNLPESLRQLRGIQHSTMSASTSGQGPAAERFGPYIEELQEFFASSCLRYGTPEDILDLTERVDSSSAFAEDLSSMVRSIVLREGGALPHSQVLEILALAIGGARMDHAAQQFSQPLRYLLSFIGGVLRRAWNEPPGDSPRIAQHAPVDHSRHHHQAEIVPFPVRPRVAGERFGSQAAGISAAADRAAHEGESGIRFGDTDERFGEVNGSYRNAAPYPEDLEENFDPNESFVSAAETYSEDSAEDDLQSGEAHGPHIVRPTLTAASAPEPSQELLHHRRNIPDLVGEPTPAERSALDPAIPAREAIEDPDLRGSEKQNEEPSPAAAASSSDFTTPSWQRAAEAVRKGEVVPIIAPAVSQTPQRAPAASANPAARSAPAFAAPPSAFEPVRSHSPAPAFMQSTMRPSDLNPEIPPAHILSPSFKPRLPRSPAGILVAGAAMLVVAGIVAASVNRTTELVGKQLPPSQSASPAASTAASLSSASAAPAKPAAGIPTASPAPAPRMRRIASTNQDDEDLDVAPPYSTPVPSAPTPSQELPAKPSPYLTQSADASDTHSARPPANEVASTGPIPAPPSASGHELPQSYVGASPATIHTYRDPDSAIVGDFRGARPIVEPRIRNVDVSSGTMGGNLISAPTPDYPTLARLAHVSGEVVIQAVVGKNGNVLTTHVLSGNHLLRGAAQDAVRRWRFKPYLMDGRPVEVSTIVTVRFKPHS